MSAFHDRDTIHAQLLRNAARLWGWGDNIPEEFTLDPVIRMLLGAVAGESQRVGQEIEASRARVMERLAEVLTPDALTLPLPAHAVATANPPEPVCSVSEKDVFQFVHNGAEMTFSPAGAFPLLGVQLRFMAVSGKVFQGGNGRREWMFEQNGARPMPEGVLWIGLSCADGLDDLSGLRFFFDWKNQPGKSALFPLLALARWRTGSESLLETATGWNACHLSGGVPLPDMPEDFFDPNVRIGRDVCSYYAPQVVSLGGHETIKPVRQVYPRVFEEWFMEEDLRRMREPVVWLEVVFPQAFPSDILLRTELGVNPFPVLNRRLNTLQRSVPFHLPVIPLELPAKEAFLGLDSVNTAAGKVIPQGPFKTPESETELRVSVRTAGVARLDERAAPALLEHTLDVIRDEYQAFAAFDPEQLGQALDHLRQQMKSMEERIRPLRTAGEGVPCLSFRGLTASEVVQIKFWTTPGHLGNGLPAGSAGQRGGLPLPSCLLTATIGGRARPVPSERLDLYRQAVLSRERLVSREDIRAFARGYLLREIWEDISVQVAHRIGQGARQGLLRCIEVSITPAAGAQIAREEWRSIVYQLENALNERSAGVLPVFVVVKKMAV